MLNRLLVKKIIHKAFSKADDSLTDGCCHLVLNGFTTAAGALAWRYYTVFSMLAENLSHLFLPSSHFIAAFFLLSDRLSAAVVSLALSSSLLVQCQQQQQSLLVLLLTPHHVPQNLSSLSPSDLLPFFSQKDWKKRAGGGGGEEEEEEASPFTPKPLQWGHCTP